MSKISAQISVYMFYFRMYRKDSDGVFYCESLASVNFVYICILAEVPGVARDSR
jgi:hypothetical protein